jgi:hypothetical protein
LPINIGLLLLTCSLALLLPRRLAGHDKAAAEV